MHNGNRKMERAVKEALLDTLPVAGEQMCENTLDNGTSEGVPCEKHARHAILDCGVVIITCRSCRDTWPKGVSTIGLRNGSIPYDTGYTIGGVAHSRLRKEGVR